MKNENNTIVYLLDDDASVLDSLAMLLQSVGLRTACFSSAKAFLDAFDATKQACLVLDIRMPGMSGLALQENLAQQQISIPLIFISGHGDIATAVRVMRAGAIDFIEKPINDQVLLDNVQKALDLDAKRFQKQPRHPEIDGLFARLTEREREVLEMMMDGRSNKEMANQLGLSPRTVETHRTKLFTKMRADSLADLIQKGMYARQHQ